jgi:SNF2 family DNA or RNA helicase
MLKVFHEKRCKVLLFSYSVKLLEIIEKFVISQGYNRLKLTGTQEKFISSIRIILH